MSRHNNPSFFITFDNKIYKQREKHHDWILVSPNYNNEDRRVSDIDILLMNGNFMSAAKARPIVNKMWIEYNPVWEYNGKKYTSVSGISIYNKNVPHHFRNRTNPHGYILVMYNGQLKWASLYGCYYPRIAIYDMNKGDQEPEIIRISHNDDGSFKSMEILGGWANADYCKPVKCIDDNVFV